MNYSTKFMNYIVQNLSTGYRVIFMWFFTRASFLPFFKSKFETFRRKKYLDSV